MHNHYFLLIVKYIIAFAVFLPLQGQLLLNYPKPVSHVGSLGDVFACEIVYASNTLAPIQVELILEDSGKVQLMLVRLIPNFTTYNQCVINRNFFYSNNIEILAGSTYLLPEFLINVPIGKYQSIIQVRSMQGDLLAQKEQIWIQHQVRQMEPLTKKRSITSTGLMENMVSWANRMTPGSEILNVNLEMNARTQLSLYGIPIQANLTISSLNGAGFQNLNQMSLRFDGQRFKKELIGAFLRKRGDSQRVRQQLQNRDRLAIREYKQLDQWLHDSVSTQMAKWGPLYQSLEDSLNLHSAFIDSLGQEIAFANPDLLPNEVQDSLLKIPGLANLLAAEKDLTDSLAAMKDHLPELGQYRENFEKWKSLQEYLSLQFPSAFIDGKIQPDVSLPQEANSENLLASSGLSKGLSWLLCIDDFGTGTIMPDFSMFTLQNQRLDGVNIGLSKGLLFGKFAYGKLRNTLFSSNPSQGSYARFGYGGQLGFGKVDGSYLKWSWFHGQDDLHSINPRDSLFTSIITPQSNHSMALSSNLSILKGKIQFFIEGALSHTIRDVSQNDSVGPSLISQWFGQSPGMNHWVGWAGCIQLKYRWEKGGLDFQGGMRRMGSGYRSFGLPFVQPDLWMAEAKISKRLFRNSLRVSVTYRHQMDNLEGFKPFTTQRIVWGGDLMFRRRQLPTIFVSYQPVQMGADTFSFMLHPIVGNVSWDFKLKKWPTRLTANYSDQFTDLSNGPYAFRISLFNIEWNIQFSSKWYGYLLGGYVYQKQQNLSDVNGLVSGFGGGGSLGKKVNLDLGLNYTFHQHSDMALGGFIQTRWQCNAYIYMIGRSEWNQFQMIHNITPTNGMVNFARLQLRATVGFQW